MRWLGEHHGQVMGMDVVEQRAGALVEHVGINPARFEQRDAALPLGALDLELREFGGEFRHLLVDVLLGLEPTIAAEGVDAEIADEQGRYHIEAERGENRAWDFSGHDLLTLYHI